MSFDFWKFDFLRDHQTRILIKQMTKWRRLIMNRYAFWNNKGGVGKSFLTFAMACEYAHIHIHKILRGILVRIQGASKVAYFTYSAFGATRNTGQKTSKIVDLFFSMILKPGPRDFNGERFQINKEPLEKYRKALTNLVSCL